jgi:hypothetical protein
MAGFYGYSYACFIVTDFYIGNGLNDMNPMQINNDCFVSHTIWFTIDCIYETVLLRFDLILWQLEKQSILTLSRLHSFLFGLI